MNNFGSSFLETEIQNRCQMLSPRNCFATSFRLSDSIEHLLNKSPDILTKCHDYRGCAIDILISFVLGGYF